MTLYNPLRNDDYIASDRNSDMPHGVRVWLSTGEGSGQDEITALTVADEPRAPGEWTCRDIDCIECGSRSREIYDLRIVLAANEDWRETEILGSVCDDCVDSWRDAETTLKRRGARCTVRLSTARTCEPWGHVVTEIETTLRDGRALARAHVSETVRAVSVSVAMAGAPLAEVVSIFGAEKFDPKIEIIADERGGK